jgi:hypothetical protein
MVNNDLLLLSAVRKFIVDVAALPVCDDKVKVMEALLDLEWSLRKPEVSLANVEEELSGGHEEPWSD